MHRNFNLARLVQDDEGATAIEYGLILALIAMALFGAVRGIADNNTGLWATVKDKVTEATS